MGRHTLAVEYFVSFTEIDFGAIRKEDYFQQKFEPIAIDPVKFHGQTIKYGITRVSQVQFEDSIYTPFEQDGNIITFMNVIEDSPMSEFRPNLEFGYMQTWLLDPEYQFMHRVRYSYWDALGDVGGFHDGLVLLVKMLLGPFTAYNFVLDILSKERVAKPFSKRQK